jgi:hypothetical protein
VKYPCTFTGSPSCQLQICLCFHHSSSCSLFLISFRRM